MSLRKLPKINAKAVPSGVQWDARSDVLSKWDQSLVLSESSDSTITMYDVIGEDPWSGGGVTAKRVAAALRSIGERDVTVSINSGGGDFFEGITIYNLLREHPHKVTVKVVGLAASAASIIAMAGDEIQIAKTGFMMVHNAWVFAVGNRHDLREAADVLDEFDGAMVDLYAESTGLDKKEVEGLLDAETWLSGQSAIDKGFATSLLDSDQVAEDKTADSASISIRKIDTILAKQGISRNERRTLLNQIKGTHDAARPVTHDADLSLEGMLFLNTIRRKTK